MKGFPGSRNSVFRKSQSGRVFTDGFTMVEVVVVSAVMIVLASIFLGYSQLGSRQVILYSDRAAVVGALERAKSLTLQKYREESGASAEGFGVRFITTAFPHRIAIVLIPAGYPGEPDSVMDEIILDRKIEIASSPDIIYFRAPYLETVNPGNIVLRVIGREDNMSTIEVGQGGQVTAY